MQIIDNALEILRILSNENEGLTVTEISTRLSIPKSSAHRLLKSLKDNKYVLQLEDNKKYVISYKLLSLTNNLTETKGLINTAKPFMKRLALMMNKTIALNVMEGESIVCIYYVESQDTPMFMIRRGYEMPLHATSAGKVFLASMGNLKVEELFNGNKHNKLTVNTITDLKSLMRDLNNVKKLGYATSDEELQVGVEGVACPIYDYNNDVVASVSFTTLKTDNFVSEENILLLKECAKKISNALGAKY